MGDRGTTEELRERGIGLRDTEFFMISPADIIIILNYVDLLALLRENEALHLRDERND